MNLEHQTPNIKHETAINRLTALWALSESGLGGMMHALKIPFTGFFLGGFAIVIITLIAHFSDKPFKAILQATVLVVLVKAAASPHSPPMAYIAVGFQGLIGALMFTVIPFFRIAAPLFGMLALFESAVQKFITATLIFGKSIWEALDAFVASVLKDLSVFNDFSFSFWLIVIYTAVYVLWGCLLGWWASGLPKFLHHYSDDLLLRYSKLEEKETGEQSVKNKKWNKKLLITFLVLAFIVIVFLLQGSGHKALFAIARTIAALLLLFYLINPLVKWLMQRWLAKKQRSTRLNELMDALPELRGYIAPAMLLARQNQKGLGVYKAFIENLIVLALYK
jgi:hypothetical protein